MPKKNTKIISWNVNGIRAVHRNGFSAWFKKVKPDILCLQETKVHLDQLNRDLKEYKGYYSYFNSAEKRGYSGTAVFSREKPINVLNSIGIKKFDSEGRFLFLEFQKFYLFNTYFPNTQRGLSRLKFKQEFNEAYLKFISKFKDKPLILTGDFNAAHKEIDLKNPKENEQNAGFTKEERAFVDKLIKKGYSDIWRELHPGEEKYTWWTYRFNARARNIGWRIDYFFISDRFKKNVKSAKILNDVYGSDHCPIELDIVV